MTYLGKGGLSVVTDSHNNSIYSINTFGKVETILKGNSFFEIDNVEIEKIEKMDENEIIVFGEKKALILSGVNSRGFRTISLLNFSDLIDFSRDFLIDLKYLGQRKILLLTSSYLIVVWVSKKNSKICKKKVFNLRNFLQINDNERIEKMAVLKGKSIIAFSVKKMMIRSKLIVIRLKENFDFEVLNVLEHKNEENKISTLMPFEFIFEVEEGSVMLESRLSRKSVLFSNLLTYKKEKNSYEITQFLDPIEDYLDTNNLKLAKIGNCCWNIDIKGNLSKLEIVSFKKKPPKEFITEINEFCKILKKNNFESKIRKRIKI